MSQDSKPDAIEVKVEKIDVDIQQQEDKILSDTSKKIYGLMFEKLKIPGLERRTATSATI
jgi:hypothetical protein